MVIDVQADSSALQSKILQLNVVCRSLVPICESAGDDMPVRYRSQLQTVLSVTETASESEKRLPIQIQRFKPPLTFDKMY